MFAYKWFKVCALFQSRGRLLPCVSASGNHCLVSFKLRLVFLTSKGFFTLPPSVGRIRLHSSPSTSLPSAPNSFRWVSTFIHVMIHFWLSALQILRRVLWNTSIVYFLWLIGWNWEGKRSCWAWARRQSGRGGGPRPKSHVLISASSESQTHASFLTIDKKEEAWYDPYMSWKYITLTICSHYQTRTDTTTRQTRPYYLKTRSVWHLEFCTI